MTLQIRALEPQDYAAWKPMYLDYASVWHEDISEERLQKVWAMLTEPSAQAYSLAAVKDGVLAGFAHYMLYPCTYSTKLTCYLQDLYVHPQARGQGVAGTLIDTLMAEGKSQGWRNVHWKTMPDNAKAVIFYSKIAKRSDMICFEKSVGK